MRTSLPLVTEGTLFLSKSNDGLLTAVHQNILERDRCDFFPTNCLGFVLL